jgi:hypothetical protein
MFAQFESATLLIEQICELTGKAHRRFATAFPPERSRVLPATESG